ncbi:MAG: Ig-like domain-containing protein [Terriglobales bacterium]|jgi:uncharacterized repeat protein (TIGR03803 family)
MNQVAIRSLIGRFKLLPTLVLVAAVSLSANARTGQSGTRVEPTDALTYSQSVLHDFTASPDGMNPQSGLVADSSGNLYGTAYYGGSGPCSGGCGTVFELSPDGNGGWTYNNIYSLPGGTVGAWPNSLTIDSQGNLYGTTAASSVFELCQEPNGGAWILCNVYGFTGGSDGQNPQGPVILDAAGNVYVVTERDDGGNGYGTVDELVLEQGVNGGGPYWSEQTLYTFTGGNDGAYPSGPLIRDKKGDFYGTTNSGGIANNGTVFKLHYTAKKGWALHTVHTFQGAPNDGLQPFGGLVLDVAGNIYGTAAYGTWPNLVGGIYKLTPSGLTAWIYVPGDAFGNIGGGLVFDKAGNLYAVGAGGVVNQYCGSFGCGAIYELTPPSGGQSTAWTANVLFGFDAGADGSNPVGLLRVDNAGNVYGVASNGGAKYGQAGAGVVFELEPNPVTTATAIVKGSPSPSKTGQIVTVGFTVAQTVKGFTQPTGTVTVNASTGEACFVALPLSGKASCQLAFESAGIRTLTATYSGDSANQGSVSGAVTQATFNSTSIKITSHIPDPAKVGKAVTVEFSVIAKDETKQTKPTGTVTVNASTGESCTGILSGGDKGKCQLTFGSSGIRTLTATYAGDADNEGSVSKAIEQAVE